MGSAGGIRFIELGEGGDAYCRAPLRDRGDDLYSWDPDRHLYFVTKGVIKLYKSYGGHKEAIVTMLEEDNIFGEPTPHS